MKPKFKVGDVTCLKYDLDHKNIIIAIGTDDYEVKYWDNRKKNGPFFCKMSIETYDNSGSFILDKQYIWEQQLKEILLDNTPNKG